jgi:uncharacterized protein (UPF0261 family)
MPSVLLISTLDTKGRETEYLAGRVSLCGCRPIVMDLSMREGSVLQADLPAHAVARAGGMSWEEVVGSQERARITEAMISGGKTLARAMVEEGRVHGILGLGGSTGSLMATEIMRGVPFGVPKLMISSTAALPGLSTRYIGTGDIALFHTVVEIAGLNDLLRNVLDRAALAISGMVLGERTETVRRAPGRAALRIAMTMLGPCERCASRVRASLEAWGAQVIGFSAAGVCDRAMEEMIAQGLFDGVVELAPGAVGEHILGGTRDAGPHRLENAGRMGLPQVIAPCGVNHLTPSRSRYRPEDHRRRKYDLDRYRTWLRATPEELKIIARAFASKLNLSSAPVVFLFPKRGWSSVDRPGLPTYDPAEDLLFVEELRSYVGGHVQIREVEDNLEEPAFADAVVQACEELFLARDARVVRRP